jgi:hypothetical protein
MQRWKIGMAMLVVLAGGLLFLATTGGAKKKSAEGPAWGVVAELNGKREISPEGNKRAGDLDGYGVFAGATQEGRLCYALAVGAIANPSAAHIHQAKRGKNGPIVITLTHPTTGNPGSSSACATPDAALLAAIRKHPNRFYVNVHNADFPNGAIRGQLRKSKGR